MNTNVIIKSALIVIFILSIGFQSNAQIKLKTIDASVDAGVDLVSRYVWRGSDFGDSPAFQPSVSISKGGFTLGSWGSFSTNSSGLREVDLFLSYNYKDIVSLTLTDYFVAGPGIPFNNYFEYKNSLTNHVYEVSANLGGIKNIPLSLLIATNFYGADAKKADGKIAYSTYIELKYSHKSIDIFAGYNATNPNTDLIGSGYYAEKAGFVNVGCTVTRKIKLTSKYSLPLAVSLITNPISENIFLVAAISL
ncbi:TorF family putative porin [Bacteroidota bacterium]